MRYQNPELRSRLAAEYALGTLQGRARSRFEKLLRQDPGMTAELAFWNARFAEIASGLPPVTPREIVWTALSQQIHADAQKVRPIRTAPPVAAARPEGFGLWRIWAVTATVATLVLGFGLWREQTRSELLVARLEASQRQPMPYVAAIQFEGSEARWAVSLHPERRLMRITAIPGSLPIDPRRKDLELWMLDHHGKPHSLGTLPVRGRSPMLEMPLPEMPAEELRSITLTLAVSEEPLGGSPTGLPTGKVLGAMPAARAL